MKITIKDLERIYKEQKIDIIEKIKTLIDVGKLGKLTELIDRELNNDRKDSDANVYLSSFCRDKNGEFKYQRASEELAYYQGRIDQAAHTLKEFGVDKVLEVGDLSGVEVTNVGDKILRKDERNR